MTITVSIEEQDSDSLVDASVETSEFMFTAANWGRNQRVVVMAIDDAIDEDEERVTVSHTVTGGDYGTAMTMARTRMFRIQDDDFRGVTVSPTSLNITEGETQHYDVKLNSQPTADVTITITKMMTGETTLGANEIQLDVYGSQLEAPPRLSVLLRRKTMTPPQTRRQPLRMPFPEATTAPIV